MLEQLKQEVYEANMLLPKYHLVTFTWGNVSGIDREKGLFVIKPSGVDYDKLTPDSMVVVNLEGEVVEGDYRPSSDTPTHVVLYNRFQEIGGVVHTHSPWATSWAQAGRGIPCYGTTHADYLYGQVPCVRTLTKEEIETAYEKNTGVLIADEFERLAVDYIATPLIAVHARTREQMYTPGIDPEIIARVKQAVHVPVLGNGDIHSAEDAVAMMQQTGCDGVMIARAALGDPWLFERVNAAIEGTPEPKAPNLQARMNALRRQVEEMVEQKGEFVAMPQARAQTMHYMKGLKGAAALRRYCCTLTHLEDLDELIDAVFEEQRKAGLDPDDVREVPFP